MLWQVYFPGERDGVSDRNLYSFVKSLDHIRFLVLVTLLQVASPGRLFDFPSDCAVVPVSFRFTKPGMFKNQRLSYFLHKTAFG